MSTTPLIKTPQAQGGTFYTFSSAAKDLTKGFSNDNLKLVFSKFVCLNLPDLQPIHPDGENDPSETSKTTNYIQLNTVLGASGKNLADNQHMHRNDMNMAFAEHMQNYMLNLEEMILSNENYDNTTHTTVAERIFFKWLIETGAIRFRNATNKETTQPKFTNFEEADEKLEYYPGEWNKYTEVTEKGSVDHYTQRSDWDKYNRVVKYIGDIDIINNVDMAGEAYSELYINIPTEVGKTPDVLFKSISDNNYGPNALGEGGIIRNYDNENAEYIVGRNSGTQHPQGLSIRAFYDEPRENEYILGYRHTYNSGDLDITKGDKDDPDYNQHLYKGYGEVETDGNNFKTSYEDSEIDQKYTIRFVGGEPDGESYRVTRSKLDGIGIDFDESHYYKIVNNPAISTFSEFNGMAETESFEFNAVLVYYDVIDSATNRASARNLYGILILDNVITNSVSARENCMPDAYIQRYPKFKPNKITGQNGNSFGFKINLRFDVAPGTSGVHNIVNEYNTFSMQVFSEAMAQMQVCTRVLLQQRELIEKLYNRILKLETSYYNLANINILKERIDKLENSLDANSAALENTDSLTDLISKNADEIEKLKQKLTEQGII